MQKDQYSAATTGMTAKMGIWLLMITVTILFGALSLAYMLAGTLPIHFSIPWGFYVNTGVLVLSSVALHVSWINRTTERRSLPMWIPLVLGIGFLLGQLFCWYQLLESGLGISESGQKGAYLWLLTGLHALHLIGGLTFLAVVYFRRGKPGIGKYLESAVYFWHFLGVLWIYLLCVLLTNTG